jgi:hypothetical protein
MNTLFEELGRENLATELLEFLDGSDNAVAVVCGASGTGKSWYVRSIGAVWEEAGGITVTAEGDQGKSHRSLFPLTYSMAALPKTWHAVVRNRGRKLFTGVGSILATLASGLPVPQSIGDGLIDLIGSDERDTLPFLTEGELKALQTLKKLTSKKPSLLIVDDYQWWDKASKDFISLLHSEQLRSKVDQLSDLRTIIVIREGNEMSSLLRDIAKFCPSAHLQQNLDVCNAAQFLGVLRAMGLRVAVDKSVENQLFDLTGGHLKVMDRLVTHLNATGRATGHILSTNQYEFLMSIISERLVLLEEDADQVLQVLKFASIVGKNFTKHELMCLTQNGSDQIDAFINLAVGERLISRNRDQLVFSHDIILEAVQKTKSLISDVEINRKYAECLRLIAPGEYALRSDLHHKLKDYHQAAVLAIQAILKLDRGHIRSARVVPQSLLERVEAEKFGDVLESLRRANSCFRSAQFKQGINEIDAMPFPNNEMLHAEAQFVKCLNLMEMETSEAFAEAIATLASFEDIEVKEFELGIRFRLLKQQVLVLSGDINGAKVEEALVFKKLSSRIQYDVDSAIKIHVANRKSDAIYQTDVAVKKIKRSVQFFQGGSDPNIPLYPREFYKSLTNLVAVLIKLGRYSEAKETAQVTSQLIRQNPEILFPRRDLLINNTIIAIVNLDQDYAAAVNSMKGLLNSAEAAGENFLYRCNYVGLALLHGDKEGSRKALDDLNAEVSSKRISETYLLYYVHCHEITWQWFYGDKEQAKALFDEFVAFVSTLNWPSKAYVLLRCEKMRYYITEELTVDIENWDSKHLDREEIGPAWLHYGRGVPLSELQFWSEI